VEVSDGVRKSQVGKNVSFLVVHLDYDLRPQGVGTSNGYDRLADSLVQEDDIDAVPDPDDFNTYRERIQYRSGRRWVTEPTLSARWKDTVEARPVQEDASASAEER
jgi:hypothetical protein